MALQRAQGRKWAQRKKKWKMNGDGNDGGPFEEEKLPPKLVCGHRFFWAQASRLGHVAPAELRSGAGAA